MTEMLYVLLGLVLALLIVLARQRLAAFRAQSPDDYDGMGPVFDLRRHLNGPLVCEGLIYGPTGRVSSRFTADMLGTWDGAKGTLAETFRYDSGAVQERAWHLELNDGGGIIARAEDVIGRGRGRQSGPAVQLLYDIRLTEDAGGHVLNVVDWMYLVDDKTIINRSQFRKYGIKVAELVATIRPRDAT